MGSRDPRSFLPVTTLKSAHKPERANEGYKNLGSPQDGVVLHRHRQLVNLGIECNSRS
jgi:hypothetical protein